MCHLADQHFSRALLERGSSRSKGNNPNLALSREPGALHGPRPLLVPRLSVLGCGAAALAVGIYSGGIIPSLLLGYTVFAGGLFIPVLTGLLERPLSRSAALTAAGLGGLCALAGKLLENNLLVAGSFAVGAGVFLVDRLLRAIGGKKKEKAFTTDH